MESTDGLNGRQIGELYVRALERYLHSGVRLPTRGGKLNVSAIATAVGVPRLSFYSNPAVLELLKHAQNILDDTAKQGADQKAVCAATHLVGTTGVDLLRASKSHRGGAHSASGVITVDGNSDKPLLRRINVLEQQLFNLTAENHELRQRVQQLRCLIGRQDMVIDTGRRIIRP